MQLAAVTEIITHFIGLFHLAETPDRDGAVPDGAGTHRYLVLNNDAQGHAAGAAHAVETAPSTPFLLREPQSDVDRLLHAWRGGVHNLPPLPTHGFHLAPYDPPPPPDLPPAGVTTPDAPIVSAVPAGSAWMGADQTVVDDHQVNMLIGNTSYVDNPAGGSVPIPSDAPVVGLIAQAYAVIPAEAPQLGQSATQEVATIKSFEDGLASGSTPSVHTLGQGTYTDGVLTSSDGSPVQLTLPVTQLDTTAPTANGVALGQTIVMGHDIAGNAALIEDTSSTPLTQIVEGNAYHADLIIQSNVLQNIDAAAIGAGGMSSGQFLFGNDTVHNTAHFEQLPDVVSTSINGSFGQQWNVQVVNGDFYDVNTVTQTNVLINDTLYAGTAMTDHYYAVLGGNTQLNAVSVTHDAPVYDLLIVLGNSYTANAIYQTNVLLNDTTTGVETSALNGNSNTVTAGHDTVTNDAAIAEYGSQTWMPTTSDLQSLVHALSTQGDLAPLLHEITSLGATINVQLVTGNYYNINLISQTNVVANSSTTLADLSKAGVGVPTNVIVGQDTLTNSAAIVSASALDKLYVAGTPYETSMLIQSNIVTTHATTSADPATALVPELVAFLDSGDAHGASASTTPTTLPSTSAAHQDLLAGHLH